MQSVYQGSRQLTAQEKQSGPRHDKRHGAPQPNRRCQQDQRQAHRQHGPVGQDADDKVTIANQMIPRVDKAVFHEQGQGRQRRQQVDKHRHGQAFAE